MNTGIIGATDNPEVSQAIENFENQGHKEQIEAITTEVTGPSLEKYGITLRKPSLMFMAQLARIMGTKDPLPSEMQPFIWIWALAVPLKKVYEGLALLDKEGIPAFCAEVHQWWDNSGIPHEVTAELMESVVGTFRLAERMMPKTDESVEAIAGDGPIQIKKNPPPGSSWSVT